MSDAKALMTLVEVEHVNEMQENLRRRMSEAQRKDAAGMHSVRPGVLAMVVAESYDRALAEIQMFIEFKAEFPAFQKKVEGHVEHCKELIETIRSKRQFPGLATLPLSKQQELHEKVLAHFEDLKRSLQVIEAMERDHKLADLRSTVIVLKMVAYVGLFLFLTLIYLDYSTGNLGPAVGAAEAILDEVTLGLLARLPF